MQKLLMASAAQPSMRMSILGRDMITPGLGQIVNAFATRKLG